MRKKILYSLLFSFLLCFSGLLTPSCTPKHKRTKKLYRSLDKHADCPDHKQRKAKKFKPTKGGKKKGKKKKNK